MPAVLEISPLCKLASQDVKSRRRPSRAKGFKKLDGESRMMMMKMMTLVVVMMMAILMMGILMVIASTLMIMSGNLALALVPPVIIRLAHI